MARKIHITADQILRARVDSWEFHLCQRLRARTFASGTEERVLEICSRLPEPQLNIYGWLDDWTYLAARATPFHITVRSLAESRVPLDMLVKWYWSESNWIRFGYLFGDLPNPAPLYEIAWKNDYPQVLPLSINISHNSVDNSGTSRVQKKYNHTQKALKQTLSDLYPK